MDTTVIRWMEVLCAFVVTKGAGAYIHRVIFYTKIDRHNEFFERKIDYHWRSAVFYV